MRSLEAIAGSAVERTRRYRRTLLSILALGLLLPGCTTARTKAADPPGVTPMRFEQYEVVIDDATRQTVLAGFFLGGTTAEVAVVHVDGNNDPRLRLYGLRDGAWVPVLDAPLGRGVLFVDVARIGGRDRLLTYERGRLNWFDPVSAAERALARVDTSYNAMPSGLSYAGAEPTGPFDAGEIPHVDVTRDVNRDGRDDLVVPDVDGFWIATQSSDGSFAEPVKLGPPEPFRDAIGYGETRSYGQLGITALTVPWYQSRVHEVDHNQDGRADLVFWNGDRFDVHYQNPDGGFDPVPRSFATGVSFDSDGAYSLLFGLEDKSPLSLALGLRKSSERTVLHAYRDMNADQVADLVTLTLSGRSLLRQRTRYEVHYGRLTPGGIEFARQGNTAIQARAKAPVGYSFQWLEDVDGDGQIEIIHGHVKTGVGHMIRALVGGSISMGLEVYRVEDGAFVDRAAATRKIRADMDVRGGRDAGFFPAVLVGDVNGDGRSDVLAGKNREELHVFLGVSGPELMALQPQEVAVALPGDERNSWLVDLNNDGKQDLLMHHASATQPHRLTMLITR